MQLGSIWDSLKSHVERSFSAEEHYAHLNNLNTDSTNTTITNLQPHYHRGKGRRDKLNTSNLEITIEISFNINFGTGKSKNKHARKWFPLLCKIHPVETCTRAIQASSGVRSHHSNRRHVLGLPNTIICGQGITIGLDIMRKFQSSQLSDDQRAGVQ